jgi:uncharacterized membrane protein
MGIVADTVRVMHLSNTFAHLGALAGRLLVAAAVVVAGLAGTQSAAEAGRAEPPSFGFAEVGDLGGTAAFALDIAPNGVLVGTARTGTAARPQVAFVDAGTGARSLGTLPGSTFSRAMGVNARGVAVGEAFTADTESSRAVLWDAAGRLRVLPGLRGPGSSAVANAINLRGDIAGVSTGTDGRATAVVWPKAGTPKALPGLADAPGATSRAWDLEATGVVVGTAAAADEDDQGEEPHLHLHAARWDRDGRVRDLGVLEDHGSSAAYAVAQPGGAGPIAVGEASLAGGSRAVVFTAKGPSALPALSDYRYARATDVSRRGWIVGHAARFAGAPTFGGSAVLWAAGKAYDLNDLVRGLPAGWTLQTAEAIDDHGRIVGYGTAANGLVRAFLLTPRA